MLGKCIRQSLVLKGGTITGVLGNNLVKAVHYFMTGVLGNNLIKGVHFFMIGVLGNALVIVVHFFMTGVLGNALVDVVNSFSQVKMCIRQRLEDCIFLQVC